MQELFKVYPFSLEFPVFNCSVNIEEIEHWRKDISSGKISPKIYYDKIERQDYSLHGDVKYLAELSRMNFLPFLAFHAVVPKTEKYILLIEEIVTLWNKQNPYLYSIHWTSGIEMGIRSVNLLFTHHILQQFQLLSKNTDREIRKQLTYNYHYLSNHLSFYSSANNHLTAELMGLNTIAAYFKVSQDEKQKWKKLLEIQIQKQVLTDGVHMERCTHYHSEVVEQFLITKLYIEADNNTFTVQSDEKIKQMFSFLSHTQYAGSETIFGDNDEGTVIFPYWQKDFSIYSSQLATANYWWETPYKNTGKIDFRNYLLFGDAFCTKANSTTEKDTLFKNAGYGFWYDHEKKIKFSFDVGNIGDDLLAAHGHSDIFHYNLMINGIDFLIDSGTYQYHTKDIFWRNYFKGISAHNTLSVNQKCHAQNNGRMSWVKRPEVFIEAQEISAQQNNCKASTNAFVEEGINKHTRTFSWNKQACELLVTDTLTFIKEQSTNIDLYWHFHPAVQLMQEGDKVIAQRNGTRLSIENEAFAKASIVSGDSNIPLGWYSQKFGEKQATKVLKLHLDKSESFSLTTKFSYV